MNLFENIDEINANENSLNFGMNLNNQNNFNFIILNFFITNNRII